MTGLMASELLGYVSHVLDTALSPDRSEDEIHPGAVLVGWQCGFEPLVVAVIGAYDGESVDEQEAIDIATDFLDEQGWFGPDGVREPDHVFVVGEE